MLVKYCIYSTCTGLPHLSTLSLLGDGLFLLHISLPLEPEEVQWITLLLLAVSGAIAAEDVASAGCAALTGAHVAAVGAF